MQTIKIPIVMRLQDNGDGGWGVHIYNSEQELLDDHPLREGWRGEPKELTSEQREEILTEDDPYTNGYIDRGTIEVTIKDDGSADLTKKIHLHVGQ
jgi:hypothetical protein